MKLCPPCLLREHERHDPTDGWCQCRHHLEFVVGLASPRIAAVVAVRAIRA